MSGIENSLNPPLDDRAKAYEKSGDMVVAIARSHANVDIDETTHARWRQLMGLMREVDTWADDGEATSLDVIEGLASFDIFRERYPDLTPESLDSEAYAAVAKRAIRILKLGEHISKATTAKRYVALRVVEAREAVNLFEDTATEYVREQPPFSEKLMPILRALGEAATLWDSIIDGKKDVRMDKQVLRPNVEYYARLTGAMTIRALKGGPGMLHVAPNIHLATKVGMRIKNRIENGIPEYSSLRLLSRKRKE